MKRGCVYRMFAKDGALLYIGATASGPARLDDHARTQPWWAEVERVDITHYDDRDHVFAAERDAIRSERPRMNRKHYDRGRVSRQHTPDDRQIHPFNRVTLTEFMRIKALDPEEVARLAGLPPDFVSGVIDGTFRHPTLEVVRLLAYAIEIAPGSLQPGVSS